MVGEYNRPVSKNTLEVNNGIYIINLSEMTINKKIKILLKGFLNFCVYV